ncbi:MAG: MFS transporter [Megasphaera sp.]|jgi:MFS family permease|nr:MFS transporter [Megasphaera sp.]
MSTEKRIFYAICLVSFIGPFLSTSLNIAIPIMSTEFGIAPDRMSWVVTSFLIASAAILLPMGKVSDIYGRKRTFSLSLMVFGVSTFATAFVPTLTLLILCRIIQGIALCGVYVSYMPLLLATTDESRQGHVLGQAVSLTYLGLSLGPVLGGILTQFAGWRFIFILATFIIAASYGLIHPIKQEWYASGAPFVNRVSTVLSMTAIIVFLYGLSSYSENSSLIWIGLLLIAVFLLHESKSYHPILPLYIFRNVTFSMSNLASFIQYSATYAISFLLSLYLQVILGLSPALSGLVLLAQPIIMSILSPRAGTLADRYGPRYIASIGLVFTTIGLGCFAVFPTVSMNAAIAFLLLIGLGAALFGAPNNSAIMGSVKPAYHGIASSMLALMRNLGQAVSMAVVTLILTRETAMVPVYTEAVQAALHVSFIILTILCFLAIFASLARGRKKLS